MPSASYCTYLLLEASVEEGSLLARSLILKLAFRPACTGGEVCQLDQLDPRKYDKMLEEDGLKWCVIVVFLGFERLSSLLLLRTITTSENSPSTSLNEKLASGELGDKGV